jgi:hypothetical protein
MTKTKAKTESDALSTVDERMAAIGRAAVAEFLSTIGRKGGYNSGQALTAEERTAKARKAGKAGAAARWGKKKKRPDTP